MVRPLLHFRQERRECRRELHHVHAGLLRPYSQLLGDDTHPRQDQGAERDPGLLHQRPPDAPVLRRVRSLSGGSGGERPWRLEHKPRIDKNTYCRCFLLRMHVTSAV